MFKIDGPFPQLNDDIFDYIFTNNMEDLEYVSEWILCYNKAFIGKCYLKMSEYTANELAYFKGGKIFSNQKPILCRQKM